ncbi:unnamed protein product [Cyprideis torosa]|uniref:Uncharacterized protein n=1 Tax=Cyprideis torosa TaxID=163714 RepID=A0A7R8ZIJ2_9CRUS|nr:unnamed protein product [Cyprideis torosa]CAG0886252.1 unnamed protein product [Cyprideis torosa]
MNLGTDPVIGFCFLVALGWEKVLRRLSSSETSLRNIWIVASVILLIAFCTKTVSRNQDWSSRESLFLSGLKTLPNNAKMHYNFGNFLKDQEEKELAIQHYREALRLWPTYASAHNNLGTLLNDPLEAAEHFNQALQCQPGHVNALFNLANIKKENGSLDEAISLMKAVLDAQAPHLDAAGELNQLFHMQRTSETATSNHTKSSPPSSTAPNRIRNVSTRRHSSQVADIKVQTALGDESCFTVYLNGNQMEDTLQSLEGSLGFQNTPFEVYVELGIAYINKVRLG